MEIKKAKPKHVTSIKALLRTTWRDTYSDYLSDATLRAISSSWHADDKLRNQIKTPDLVFLIAKNEDESLTGVLSGRIESAKKLDLDRLYVHPDFQRKGIGSRLLQYVVTSLSELREISLQVMEKNKKGINFWRKNGFEPIKKKQIEIEGETIQSIQMKRRLQ